MFIEIAELIKCPERHEEVFCVVSADRIEDRRIVEGVIGCPVCKAEYQIQDYVVDFSGASESTHDPSGPTVDIKPQVMQALLNLSNPGGNVALVGSASLVAGALARQLKGVHHICVNVPGTVRPSFALSVLQSPDGMPLRSSSMRGVVLGADYSVESWLQEARRVLLRGQRLVVLSEIQAPEGVGQLVKESGVFVGEKK